MPNPMRKKQYGDYLRSVAWKEKREQVRQRVRDRFMGYLGCEQCGCIGRECVGRFHCHHLQYPRFAQDFGKEPISWIAHLCESCHAEAHGLTRWVQEVERSMTLAEIEELIREWRL